MEINIEDYISEEQQKEIVIDVFRKSIEDAFGRDEYSDSGKERDRVIKNAVSHWITEYIEKTLTEEDKNLIRETLKKTIESGNYGYYLFKSPDVWDRKEYTVHKLMEKAVRENEGFILDRVTREIKEKFEGNTDEL